MAEVDPSLIYEILKKMQADMSDMKADIGELKMRATATDEHLSGIFISTTGINNRMDRLDSRLERIERRLDLTDAR
jgi:predicted  nucleic acid-binding Zn-ribbon protein